MIVDAIAHHSFRIELSAGIAVFAATVVVVLVLFRAIQIGKLPLRCWYALPVIIGLGVGVSAGQYVYGGLLSELGAVLLGVGTVLCSYSALQFWADTRGPRDWYGILTLTGLLLLNTFFGMVVWYAGG